MKTTTTEVMKLIADYRFMRYAEFPEDDTEVECIIWRGRMNQKKGRDDIQAIMRVEKGWTSARRYAWNLLYSQLTPQVRLRNECGNLYCVNPDHYTRTDSFCKFGHALVGANLHIQYFKDLVTGNTYSYERCRECGRNANTKQRQKSVA